MDKKQKRLQDLEQKGWDAMKIALDQEMPKRRFGFIWFLLFMGLAIGMGIAWSILSEEKAIIIPKTIHQEPLASNDNMTNIKNQITEKKNNDTHKKINAPLTKSEIKTNSSYKNHVNPNPITNTSREAKASLFSDMKQEPTIQTAEQTFNDPKSKRISNSSQRNKAENFSQKGKLANLQYQNESVAEDIELVAKDDIQEPYITPDFVSSLSIEQIEYDKKTIEEIELPKLKTSSKIKTMISDKSRKFHPFVFGQFGVNPKYSSLGLALGLGVAYDVLPRMTINMRGSYLKNNYNKNLTVSQSQDLMDDNLSWSNQNNSAANLYINSSNGIELFLGIDYKLSTHWGVGSSIGFTTVNISKVQYNYDKLLEYEIQNQKLGAGQFDISLDEVKEKYNSATVFNSALPLSDVHLSWHYNNRFSLDFGYTHYFKTLIKDIKLESNILLQPSIEASRFYVGMKIQI